MKQMTFAKRKVSNDTINKIKRSIELKKLNGYVWKHYHHKLDINYIKRLRGLGFGYRGIAEELYIKDGIKISHVTIKNRLEGKYI